MPGESPLNMMRRQRPRRYAGAAAPPRRRRLWPVLLPVCVVIVLAVGWCWAVVLRRLDCRPHHVRLDRRAKPPPAGSIPAAPKPSADFRSASRRDCTTAGAAINSTQPPFAVSAKDVSFAAQVYRPTLLVGEITGPLTVAEPGQPPSFVANWSRAQGQRAAACRPSPTASPSRFDQPHVDQIAARQRHHDVPGRPCRIARPPRRRLGRATIR